MCEKEADGLRNLCYETERVGLFETTVRFHSSAADITFTEAYRLNIEGCTEKGWNKNASKTLVYPSNSSPKNPRMKFLPSCATVHAMFLEVLNGLRSTIAEVPRLISSPSLSKLMVQFGDVPQSRKRMHYKKRNSVGSSSSKNSSGNTGFHSIEQLLLNSPTISICREDILNKITIDYDEAEDMSMSFSYLRGIYDFEASFDPDVWLGRSPGNDYEESESVPKSPKSRSNSTTSGHGGHGGSSDVKDISLEQIQELLYKSDIWTERLTKGTKNGQAIGVVHVETKTLQRELAPAIKLANETACIALQKIGSIQCLEQLNVYTERLATMESEPTSLSHFSDHLDKINQHRDGLDALKHQDTLVSNGKKKKRKRRRKQKKKKEEKKYSKIIINNFFFLFYFFSFISSLLLYFFYSLLFSSFQHLFPHQIQHQIFHNIITTSSHHHYNIITTTQKQ